MQWSSGSRQSNSVQHFSMFDKYCTTTPTGNNPGWICDCRQLYLTQELDLLCIKIVVVLTKSFIFLYKKNKKLPLTRHLFQLKILVSRKSRATQWAG
jgi:hypothetical protein